MTEADKLVARLEWAVSRLADGVKTARFDIEWKGQHLDVTIQLWDLEKVAQDLVMRGLTVFATEEEASDDR